MRIPAEQFIGHLCADIGAARSSAAQWATSWMNALNEGRVEKCPLDSINDVYFIKAESGQIEFVAKRRPANVVNDEIAEQQRVTKLFEHDDKIAVPRVFSVLSKANIPGLGNSCLIVEEFFEGRLLSKVLKERAVPEAEALLLSIVRINARIIRTAQCTAEVDPLEKIQNDIANLQDVPNGLRRDLVTYSPILTKFQRQFSKRFYDLDAIAENRLLGASGQIVLIDHEPRKNNELMYPVVRAIEHSATLPFDNAGIQARERLVRSHVEELGSTFIPEIAMPHYYLSIVAKAIGNWKSRGEKWSASESVRRYFRTALSGLTVLLRCHRAVFDKREIKILQELRSGFGRTLDSLLKGE